MSNTMRLREGNAKWARDANEAIRKRRENQDAIERAVEIASEGMTKPTGSLTVRGNATEGMISLTSGHGIVTGQLFTLAWEGGSRTKVVAGAVDNNNVPFSGGGGNDLPVLNTVIEA